MPANNPMGYAKKANSMFAKMGSLGRAKSSGGMSQAALAKSGKIRSAMVAGGVAGIMGLGNRRGRGVDKGGRGRPTGMYKY